MKFRVEIETGNEAFAEGDLCPEVARILTTLAKRVERENDDTGDWPLFDVNGNRVGHAGFSKD